MSDRDHGRADELITSASNPTMKLVRALQQRRGRERHGALLVEGSRALLTAVEHGARIKTLLIDDSRAGQIDRPTLARLRTRAERVLFVEHGVFVAALDTEHPQAIAAICDIPAHEAPMSASLVLALDAIRDPGNLGTLVRTAAAAAVEAVALLPGCVDPFGPKVVRASAGLVFALPLIETATLPDVTALVPSQPQIVQADADAMVSYDEIDWSRPSILVLGGEAAGFSAEVRTYAETRVRIPMAPGVDSLNVAVAGAIVLFECVRQRRQRGMKSAYIRGN